MKKKSGTVFMSIGMLLILSVVVGAFLDVCLASSLPDRKCAEKKVRCQGGEISPACACSGSVDGKQWNNSWVRGTDVGTTEIGLERKPCYILLICCFKTKQDKVCTLMSSGKYECRDSVDHTCQSPTGATREKQCYYMNCTYDSYGE